MKNSKAKELLKKYRSNTLSNQERTDLESWYISRVKSSKAMDDPEEFLRAMRSMDSAFPFASEEPRVRTLWPRIAATAAVLILLGYGIYFYTGSLRNKSGSGSYYATDITPGTNKAVLILADGRKVVLDDAVSGTLATEQGVKIRKTKEGRIIYDLSAGSGSVLKMAYNTIETPKGGQYQVILPDGSAVWLNAASALKYPVAFSRDKRMVELKGEAYFEVAKKVKVQPSALKSKEGESVPFIVQTKEQKVEVLGTHFNINSYEDEEFIKTTLMEGLVRVTPLETTQAGDPETPVSRLLHPGQQAVLKGGLVKISSTDTELAIAWKNGEFSFRNEDLQSILRKVARWYDVRVEYRSKQANGKTFSGTVSRFDNISKVLHILELTGDASFKIEGRKVIVLN